MTKPMTPCLRGEPTIPECLNCTEAVCIEDLKDTDVLRKTVAKKGVREARNKQILAWKEKGKSFNQIAEITGLTRRHVVQIVADERRKVK